ncbi:polysaccharide deacetylase family protein [Paenibacillus sp. 481]|uniref:polysaccharide deacetylase family protein n=1 Tax=Paenibacillus sp. 481 TaxID=2835869 RepID=UPI001E3D3A38|nr:polysaccharide deacetylase family protein [Paenibacillus sp. 481]UHA74257.1 polysaccharide deacetylase family protein [Paenibacillus sp. 481]
MFINRLESDVIEQLPVPNDGNRYVCLTLDDGPDPTYTPLVLDLLAKHNAKATFFMIGKELEKHGDTARRVRDEGHELANHTYTHPSIPTITSLEVRAEVIRTAALLEAITGKVDNLFRPPYGEYNDQNLRVLHDMGYRVVMWSEKLEMRDWESPGVDVLVEIALKEAFNGGIMLFHDGGGNHRMQTVEALRIIVPRLTEQGYRFVTVSHLLELCKPNEKK